MLSEVPQTHPIRWWEALFSQMFCNCDELDNNATAANSRRMKIAADNRIPDVLRPFAIASA